jgi:hypothetical protein
LQEEVTLQQSETTEQYDAEVGFPVKWKKILTFSEKTTFVETNLPLQASNIDISKKIGGEKTSVENEKIKINEKEENKTLKINDDADEIEIEYETPPPEKKEQEMSNGIKRVIVSSDMHYENVKVSTEIAETEKDFIRLYWIKETGKEIVNDVTYIDYDNDGKIDRLEWVVPSLSEQIFEVTITVLNVQSYPMVGGTWAVNFTTTGTEENEIRINVTLDRPANGTVYTTTNSLAAPSIATTVNMSLNYLNATKNVAAGNEAFFRFWLTVPVASSVGTYTNTIQFVGKQAGTTCP